MGKSHHGEKSACFISDPMYAFFTPPSLSNYVAIICLVAFIELHGVHGSLVRDIPLFQIRNKLYVGTVLIKNGTISMKVGTIAVR